MANIIPNKIVLMVIAVLICEYGYCTIMTIAPASVHLDDTLPPTVNMACNLSSHDQKAIVHQMSYLDIQRHSKRDDAVVIIAKIHPDNQPKLGDETDVTRRIPKVTGELHLGDNTVADPHRAELNLVWDSSTIECQDDGQYMCVWSYIDDRFQTQTISTATDFSVENTAMVPAMKLQLLRDGSPIGNDEGTADNKYKALLGSEVHMTCAGSIGSNQSAAVDWYRTKPLDDTNFFEKFIPGDGDSLVVGEVVADNPNCRFTRETTLKYIVRHEDLGDRINLAFKCAITVDQKTVDSDRFIFINAVTDMNSASSAAIWVLPLPVLISSLLTSCGVMLA